jgi:hypothetical protein
VLIGSDPIDVTTLVRDLASVGPQDSGMIARSRGCRRSERPAAPRVGCVLEARPTAMAGRSAAHRREVPPTKALGRYSGPGPSLDLFAIDEDSELHLVVVKVRVRVGISVVLSN